MGDPETEEPYSCACCRKGGKQCGYPQHNWCTSPNSKTGCKAVNQYRYTLSEIGHPCHFDPSRRDCAWCNYNGFQCGNFTKKNQGKYCKKFIHNSYDCYGTTQDCRNFPELCGPNASCVNTGKKVYKDWKRFSCACNSGWIGNGITCVKEDTGILSPPPMEQVSMQLILTTEFVNTPDAPEDMLGPSDNDLITDMENMLHTGTICSGCNSTVATCEA